MPPPRRQKQSFKNVLEDELGAELAGRAAELLIRALPPDEFALIYRFIPKRLLKVDDLQDLVARFPRAAGRLAGLSPLITEMSQTATKEALEEVNKRANELLFKDNVDERAVAKDIVSNLPIFKSFDQFLAKWQGKVVGGKPVAQEKSFYDRLAECTPAEINSFRGWLESAYPLHIANPVPVAGAPAQVPNPNRERVVTELGRIAVTKERVLLVISSRNADEFRESLEHLIRESARLPEPDRSLLSHTLRRFGLSAMGEEVMDAVKDVNKRLGRFAARHGRAADRLGRLRFK